MAGASAVRKMEDMSDNVMKSDKAEKALRQVEDKAEDIRLAAMEEISALMATLNEKVRAIGIGTDEWVESTRDKAQAIEKSVVREVAEHPLRTLVFAAFAGWALGWMSRK